MKIIVFDSNVTQPEDKGILLKDIVVDLAFTQGGAIRGRYKQSGGTEQRLEKNNMQKTNALTTVEKDNILIYTRPHGYCKEQTKEANKYPAETQDTNSKHLILVGRAEGIKGHDYNRRVYSPECKAPTLASASGGNLEPKMTTDGTTWRKLLPIECERLQTFPDNYTEGVSNSQRYKMLGNSWTVDVIAHIFKGLKEWNP